MARVNTVEKMRARHVVVDEGGCWIWTAKVGRNGYGHTSIAGRSILAHRAFYEDAKGKIPAGLTIDHLCRNRRCVNPDHLEAVSQRENNLRAPATVNAINHAKKICDNGHALRGKNVYRRKDRPTRECRACRALATARYAKKMKESGRG